MADMNPHDRVRSSRISDYWIYLPILICILIMLPRLASPQFGLLDDGRSITISQSIIQGKWDLSWDIIAGRARPLYWLGFAFWYWIAGNHPFWYFLGNLLVFSASTLLLIRFVKTLGGTPVQAFLTGLIFTLSTPVIENVYTLSKGENLQILLLLSAIWLVFHAVRSSRGFRYWLLLACASLLILLACFTKESSLVMIPLSLVWWAVAFIGRWRRLTSAALVERVTRRVAISSIVGGGLFYLARTLMLSSKLLGVGQSSQFSFAFSQLLNSFIRWGGWILRDYLWLIVLSIVTLIACLIRKRWPRSGLWWLAIVWMVFWLGLYLPWHLAVGYYLMPFALGAAVLSGVLLSELLDLLALPGRLTKGLSLIALAITGLLLLLTQANSYTDAAIQLAQDAANAQVMEYVAKTAPQDSQVVVNIQLANEYIETMQLMLANLYHRGDLSLSNYQGEDLSLQKDQPRITYFMLARVENQPKMTVRMGINEPSLQIWNASVTPWLATWHEDFQITATPCILTIDFPRLLCSVIYRENYCSAGSGLINYSRFLYQWSVYTP